MKSLKMERFVAIDTIPGSGLSSTPESSHTAIRPFSAGQQSLPSTYNEYLQLQASAEILKPSLVTVISLGSVSNYTFLAACSRSSLLVYNIPIT